MQDGFAGVRSALLYHRGMERERLTLVQLVEAYY